MTYSKSKLRYERKAYRIIQRHIKQMLLGIPLDNVGLSSWEMLIASNITAEKVKAMLVEVYYTIGKQAKKQFKIEKKFFDYSDEFLQEVLAYINANAAEKIVTIQNTLIKTVVAAIRPYVTDDISLTELKNLIYKIGNSTGKYYKWQALRIAVTETTTAANHAKFVEAQKSDLVLLKKWVSLNDNRVRHSHMAENGQTVELNEPFIMSDGSKLMFAGDPNGIPSQVINCRCTLSFIPKKDKDGNYLYKN